MLEETVQQLVHMNQNFCATIEQQQAQFNQLLHEGNTPNQTRAPPMVGQDKQTSLWFWLDAIPHFDGKKHEDFFEVQVAHARHDRVPHTYTGFDHAIAGIPKADAPGKN